MYFTLYFVDVFFTALIYTAPLFIALALVIIGLGRIVGWMEGWSWIDSVYYAFITATTVGYGDFHPHKSLSKLLSILVTFTGMVFTGILVALALQASTKAFDASPDYQELMNEMEKIEKFYETKP